MSIIIFLIILALLILVHEFGHFIVAKKSGIRVDEFGLGFPPKLFSKKYGETTYSLNAIPFGGFVKIFGEDAPTHPNNLSEEDRSRNFYFKPKWVQALVLVAGVTFNVIFAWLLISLGFMIGLPSSVDHPGFGKVSDIHTVVIEVLSNSPAQKSGLSPGDVLVSLSNGDKKISGDDLRPASIEDLISKSNGAVELVYTHGKEEKQALIVPNVTTIPGKRAIGISMDSIGTLKVPFHLALLNGLETTWNLLKATTIGLLKFLYNLVIFKSDFSQVSGPIGILGVVGEAKALGFIYLLSLTAIISLNLAIINLLPLPALDGGRLFFVLIEAVFRRPLSPKFVKYANLTGFALLIILMIFVTVHDILKL